MYASGAAIANVKKMSAIIVLPNYFEDNNIKTRMRK